MAKFRDPRRPGEYSIFDFVDSTYMFDDVRCLGMTVSSIEVPCGYTMIYVWSTGELSMSTEDEPTDDDDIEVEEPW